MSAKTTLDAEEWFQNKCDQLGISPDDLVHPGDVDHEDAEWLIGARVLHFDEKMGLSDSMRRDDFKVQDIQELPTGKGDMMFAIYYYRGDEPRGMNIEASREDLEKWDRHVRFIPEDVDAQVTEPESVIERLQDMSSGSSLYAEDAAKMADTLGGEVDPDGLHGDTLQVTSFLRRMVAQVTDESPISAGEYFGRSIGGHKKADRGEYKANLTILEEHFGMEPSYSRKQ